MNSPKVLLLFLLGLAPISSYAVPVIMSEQRREEYLDKLKELLDHERPGTEELAALPDPFRFGREIEEERPPPIAPGITDEELLTHAGELLQQSVIGFQSFGGRSFLATKDFGLLRNGDVVEIALPNSSEKKASVVIIDPTADHFTVQINDLTMEIPLQSGPSGIEQSRP
tara:strand:+ start:12383 stop:12892 length:510 start_codon:yes stop_codon:yes gene_type:complete